MKTVLFLHNLFLAFLLSFLPVVGFPGRDVQAMLKDVPVPMIAVGLAQSGEQPDSTSGGKDALPIIPPLGMPQPPLKYSQSFGEFQVPYYDEPTHLNYPSGVAVDGERVWIAEYIGKRALLYNSDTTFVKQINRARGYLEFVLAEIEHLCDVAVTSDHNAWLAFHNTVVKVNPDGGFLAYAQGAPSNSYNCHYLAVDSADRLYVSDIETHLINVYDASGAYLQTIGGPGSGEIQFNTPMNMAAGNGLLYVAEQNNHRIQILDVHDLGNITFVAFLDEYVANATSRSLLSPSGVAVDATRIFVADTGNHRVEVFDRDTRAYLATLGDGGQGPAENQWNRPYDISIASNGLIYISDMDNHRVKQYDTNLVFQFQYGETGVAYQTDPMHFNYPYAIQADLDGNLYISEKSAHRVVKLSSDGLPLDEFGQLGVAGDDETHFNNPAGLAVDATNRLYVADRDNHRIMVFSSSGTFLQAYGSIGNDDGQFNNPEGVAINPVNGQIVVADRGNGRVQIFDQSWNWLHTIPALDAPRDVVVDSQGNVYISDGQSTVLWKCVWVEASSNYACSVLVGELYSKGEPFFHFQNNVGLGIDPDDRVYIADQGLGIVYIYDGEGNFYGSLSGLLPLDVTVDAGGNVYVNNSMNQQIDKYAPVDLNWEPLNIQGFGDRRLHDAPALVAYQDNLYAAYGHWNGSQVWQYNAPGDWTQVASATEFGSENTQVAGGIVFNDRLFVSMFDPWDGQNTPSGADLFAFNGTTWSKVAENGIETPTNQAFSALEVFGSYLYIGTNRMDTSSDPPDIPGAQIYRSSSGDAGSWEKILDFSMMDPVRQIDLVVDMEVHAGVLYASVWNYSQGGELWRTSDGTHWQPVETPPTRRAFMVQSMLSRNGYLYFGTNAQPSAIWRCDVCDTLGDFENVASPGLERVDQDQNGFIDNEAVIDFRDFNGTLYAITKNLATGAQTWRSREGVNWEKFNPLGLGIYADDMAQLEVFEEDLFAGSNSTRIWKMQPRIEVFKTGTGSGVVTSSPAGIDCGAICSEEFLASTEVVLSAAAAPGSVFSGWSGEGCSGTGTCTLATGQWRSVTAEFAPLAGSHSLTVQSLGNGSGFVTSLPAGIFCGDQCNYRYPSASLVRLQAQALDGSFTGWGGACAGSGDCVLDLSEDRVVSATFENRQPGVLGFTRNNVENQDFYFTPADFGSNFIDPDQDPLMRIIITSLPAYGTLKLAGKEVYLYQQIAYSIIARLYYQPLTGFSGTDQFAWYGNDGAMYSAASANVTIETQVDADGDGSGDALESAIEPLLEGGLVGDGNGDGIVDTLQSNVASLQYLSSPVNSLKSPPAAGSQATLMAEPLYLTVAISDQLAFADVIPLTYPSGNPPVPDDAANFPIGFLDLYIKGIAAGAEVEVELFVNDSSWPDQLLAYGAEEEDVEFHWYDFSYNGTTGAQVERLADGTLKYTLHFVDGGYGDNDLTPNGLISAVFGVYTTWRTTYLPILLR